MNIISHPHTVSTSPHLETKTLADALIGAAGRITLLLEQGKVVTTGDLRQIMIEALGGSDAEGLWLWKDAYKATEVAQVLFLRKFGAAITARVHAPQSALAMLNKVARLVPRIAGAPKTARRCSSSRRRCPLALGLPRRRHHA
ncbi:hypothetical protein AJ87_18725 [Rhizobium yanglingense]|nr:hypothetical protein AJ87_18725 [Rhizobium yanglingense]